MARRKKTFTILYLLTTINDRNKYSHSIRPEVRQGWNSILEHMLHAANVYAGFGYYTAESLLPLSERPGIVYGVNGAENEYPDETRRFYYVHRSIQPSTPSSPGGY